MPWLQNLHRHHHHLQEVGNRQGRPLPPLAPDGQKDPII